MSCARCREHDTAPPTIERVSNPVPHIGTLREKPLHASLKRWCALPGDRFEVPVDGFVVDLVRDGLLIEVQTRGFASMKKKIVSLLDSGHRVRIVHSIPIDRWIVKVDADGTILSRRRSPKHGKPTDVFVELVSFPELLVRDHLEVEVVMSVEEEYRRHTPGTAWRRNGWTVVERRLVEVVDSVVLNRIGDFTTLLPDGLPEVFTTADVSEGLGRPLRAAQQMTYCLRKAGAIAVVGKRGNSLEYEMRRPGMRVGEGEVGRG